MNKTIKGFYFIIGGHMSLAGDISDVREAIKVGVQVVQYRNKNGTSKEIYEEALKL